MSDKINALEVKVKFLLSVVFFEYLLLINLFCELSALTMVYVYKGREEFEDHKTEKV